MAKPNKENIITDMLIELEKGISYSDCLALNGTKWNLPKTTFVRYWKSANERHAINQESTQKAIAEQSIEAGKERVKTAIKSKIERLEILQNQINSCQEELEKNITIQMILNNDGEHHIPRALTIKEKVDLRNTIKNLQAEISKIEGDYSPIRTDITTGGDKLNAPKPDLSKLSKNTLLELKNSFFDDGNRTK
jgi:chromosome segregation ATPase